MIPFYQKTIISNYPVNSIFRKKISLSKVLSGVLVVLFFTTLQRQATGQVSLSSTVPVSQNFDGIATTALPANWKVTHSFQLTTTLLTTAPSTTINVPTATLVAGMSVAGTGIPAGATVQTIINASSFQLSAATVANVPNGTALLFSNGNTVTWANTANRTSMLATNVTTGSAGGSSYVYTAGIPAGTDKSIGIQASATFAGPQSIMVHYRNTSGATMTDLSINYDMERYRISTQPAQVDFFYSLDGVAWTPVAGGNVSAVELGTGTTGFTFGAPTPPLIINKTAAISGLSLPSGGTGNIYIRWNINCTPTPTQAISIDNVTATATFLACSTPASQPTALTFPSVGTAQISGSFAPAGGPPNGYLVVRYPAGSAATAPSNGVVYTAGTPLGLGTVVSASAGTTFTATGLATGTNYDFYVYSYNSTSCVGPAYRTAAPLTASQATGSCAGLSAVITIDPVGPVLFGASYNTISAALNDLSGCPITQPTVIELQSNYVSTGETFPIALGAITGASAVNTLTIRPAAGATNLSITGNSVGAPILNITGGSWWRVDGRAGGVGTTRNLTIENTDNTVAFSSAIRLINGSENNLITYCRARSANVGVAGGSISIADGTLSTGNNNNTISNNEVFASSAGIPNVGIGCVGLNTANNGNTIANNSIYDFFNPAGNSYGIYVSDLNTNLTISGNSIYQTASRTLTGGAANRVYAPIGVSPTTASTVTGLTISGNFIGGTAPNCGGSPSIIQDNGTATLILRAIFVQAGTTPATSIQGNTIRNLSFTTSSTSVTHSLINAETGAFNIGTSTPNTLGSTTGTGSITFNQSNGGAGRFNGIFAGNGTPGAITISNNALGSISVSGTGNISMAGIYCQGAAPSYSLSSNQIGGTTTGSIANSSGSGSDTWGIYTSAGTTSNTITGNTIQNMSSGTGRMLGIRTDGGVNSITSNIIRNNASNSAALTGCIGIWANSSTAGQTLTGNQIHSLSNTETSAAATVQGIYYTGPTSGTNVIERNFVHSFSLATSNTAGALYGIRVLTGAFPVDVQNNMIRLGIDASGSDVTTGYAVFGIATASTATTTNRFNTSYVGGTGVSGTTSNTFAFFSSTTLNTRSVQNNVFVNTRDGGTTGKHYAFSVAGTGLNPAGLTMDNNLYQTTGSNGFPGLYGTDLADLATIQTTLGGNTNSWVCDPKLINPDGNAAAVDLHIQPLPTTTLVESKGVPVAGIATDFDGNVRSTIAATDMGADEGNFGVQANCNTLLTWNGSSSNVWGTPANWMPSQAPTAFTPVIIPAVTPAPVVSGSVSALSVTLGVNGSISIGSGATLNVKGDAFGDVGSAISGAGKVAFNGTALQTISGSLSVSNVDFGNSSVSGVVVSPTGSLRIAPNGVVSFLANSRLATNNNLILSSDASGTAKVGVVPASATITGNLTQERYLPYSSGAGSWYLLGSPMGGANDFREFSDDFKVTGLSTGFGTQGGGIINSTEPERSSIFKYDETLHNLRTDTVQKQGWRIPAGIDLVEPGKGYRVYVDYASNASHKFDTKGTITRNDFTWTGLTHTDLSVPGCISSPLTFPCDEANTRGWNLIANPYPCDINWDALPTAWTKPAQMNNAFYTYNGAVAGGYRAYLGTNASTGTPGVNLGTTLSSVANPNLIPSNQAFFVKVTSPGSFSMTVRESAKVTSASGSFVRTTASSVAQIRLRLTNSSMPGYQYDAMVRMQEGATDGFDNHMDLENFQGTRFNFAFRANDNQQLLLNAIAPVSDTRTMPMVMNLKGTNGNYTFSFSEMESLTPGTNVYLKDNFTNHLVAMDGNGSYSFSVSGPESASPERFELIISPSALTSVNGKVLSRSILVYPNPSVSGQSALVVVYGKEGAQAEITVTDNLGREVVSQSQLFNAEGAAEFDLKGNLPAGMYTIKARAGSQVNTRKWVVQ